VGLIRKSFAVGTLGVVKGSSKKQRVAKATMKSSAAAAATAANMAATTAAADRLAEQQAEEDREFRYATDPVYRDFIDKKRAAEEAERLAQAAEFAEVDRLRRVRNQQRWDIVKRAVTLTGVAVTILLVSVLVWLPQLAIGKIRHRPVQNWMQPQLHGVWAGAAHPGGTPS
jgi:hypothetical protein